MNIGFGRMASARRQDVTDLVLSAVRSAGVGAVLLSGRGALASLLQADDDFCADAVPHIWLFPRVAAVVNHGGPGAPGALLSAGVPALVIPFADDQPFWGAQVSAPGADPSPVPRKKLTAPLPAHALRVMVDNQAMRERASKLGREIRAEHGVAEAVECFNKMSGAGKS